MICIILSIQIKKTTHNFTIHNIKNPKKKKKKKNMLSNMLSLQINK